MSRSASKSDASEFVETDELLKRKIQIAVNDRRQTDRTL